MDNLEGTHLQLLRSLSFCKVFIECLLCALLCAKFWHVPGKHFGITHFTGTYRSQLLPGQCWIMSRSPYHQAEFFLEACCSLGQPLCPETALVTMWSSHCFWHSWLAWVADRQLYCRAWGRIDQPTSKRTPPGTTHTAICFCFSSNCAATQGRPGAQAHAVCYFLVRTKHGFHVAGDERVRSALEGGVFPIMQIASKYFPHSIVFWLGSGGFWIPWKGILTCMWERSCV